MKLLKEQLEKYSKLLFLDEHDYVMPSIIQAEFGNDINSLLYVLEYVFENKGKLGLCKCFPTVKDKFRINNMLRYRISCLNKQFSWTEENKKRFLLVNDSFISSCENAWNEAVAKAMTLEERIKNNDPFIKDYEIEITFDVFPSFEDADRLTHVIDYFAGRLGTIASISHSAYETCLDIECPPDIDKKESWNFLGEEAATFKDEYLSKTMHDLLFHSRCWSRHDILSVHSIWADVQVTHQNYVELEPYRI